ncbi:vitamin K epoxide reductase family protein [Glaciihabitans sp. dw_435]|uniref:vitamin K epoxide reductase family protein n=1 Tax=Glaciihabitans sp. dw_435 TaxID=2720081 RepID=UPI001BD3E79F|nr:vitamin K epoxide reductase family protein [Glaciihabitans sp. dw_435]
MIDSPAAKRPIALAIFLIISGAIGLYSAFELTLAKFEVLENPQATLSCNFSLIVQCGKNLESAQGAIFGFPNPVFGLGCFVAPIAVGVGVLAGAQFARWFWIAFNVGVALALTLVIWLLSQSIFVLGTLCPWCMVVWAVVIPMFWAVTLYTLSTGIIPTSRSARAFFERAYGWIPIITLLSYVVVAVIAQLRLDVLAHL